MTMHDQRTTPASARARGFSFTEVLFAVMILGIGFIMVAAIFPVAIQQAQSSTEETTAAAVGRTAATVLEQVASNSTMPATNNVFVGPDYDGDGANPPNDTDGFSLAMALRGSLVMTGDSRYAWVPLYRRGGDPSFPATWSRVAQVIMIPVLSRNESEFSKVKPDVFQRKTGVVGTAGILANFYDGQNGAPDTVQFRSNPDIASEGAYVIVADARRPGRAGWNQRVAPELQGRIYRLGSRTAADPNTWELMPGFDLEPIRVDANGSRTDGAAPNPKDGKETVIPGTVDFSDVMVFVVGRGVDPNSTGGNPARLGPAQDVTVYTTFITVRD
jgi:type II secretory pathway pseudopilin PulG